MHCVKDNGHRWRTREGTRNLAIGRSELGLVEGANAAPTPIKEVMEISERRRDTAEGAEQPAVDSFEERCVDATMSLTHAMSPTVVLLVQALGCPVKIWNWLERQYEKRTAASKLSLVQKYFRAKMAEGESAEKNLLKTFA